MKTTTYYTTKDQDNKQVFNRIDVSGNHFQNGKCVNPIVQEDGTSQPIGSTVDKRKALKDSLREVETNVAENIWLAQEELKNH